MTEFNSIQLRNLALVGHGKSGKTLIAENCLFKSGAVNRVGKSEDGTSVLDYEPEEIKRKMTIDTSLASCQWQGYKINLLDTPGYPDFTGEVKSALMACEAAIVVVSAVSGVEVETDKAWQYAEELSLPRAIFINKMDREHADFNKVVEELRAKYGKGVVPIQLPIGSEDSFQGVADLITMNTKVLIKNKDLIYEIPEYMEEEVDEARHMLMETCAEFNDELLEKYLEGEEITETEVAAALIEGIVNARIFPVLCGSAAKGIGFRQLMNSIVEYMPTPYFRSSMGVNPKTNELIERNTEDAFSGYVFKTVVDQFIGRISYLKVLSGTLQENAMVYNSVCDKTERVANFYTACGKNQQAQKIAHAGDIIIVTKLQSTKTGDTLCDVQSPIRYESVEFADSMFTMAIKADKKTDEDKIGNALNRLIDEDPTLKLEKNTETGDLLISGVGEAHLDIALEKLLNKFGVTAKLYKPEIAYRETIRGTSKVEGKHKKQSGGHGQYGDVWLEFSPGEQGSGVTFTETIVGGAVPRQYIPAVEKGVRETLQTGILAGYPMVDIKVNLYDGSYHTVDSSEMAFKTAAAIAIKKGIPQAKPVLLEPYCNLKITIPEYYMGDVISGINTKRGRILSTESPSHSVCIIEAQVPQAELYKYATDLRSATQGRGSYTMTFSHYEEVPAKISEKIVAERTK